MTGLIRKITVFMARIIRRIGGSGWLMRTIHVKIFHNTIGEYVKFHGVCKISGSSVGSYTYFGGNASVNNTHIGKFCSIGPNFISGWGIHPVDGLSTSPMFYSTAKQNGITLTNRNKVEEHLPINIGNDVFIGANVMILDGVNIGNGAVIGAGSVVTKDIPDYAITGGVPAKIIRYRFSEENISKLNSIKWWDFPEEKLKSVEKYFSDPQGFIDSALP
ncbi:MAG: CatB-related O-acetyltransferase [Rikenellaceae bacterium]|nr:CatB-related O-acetyltransferase [Rikenellaceae bacterium]